MNLESNVLFNITNGTRASKTFDNIFGLQTLLSFIFVFSLIGNSLVIAVVYRNVNKKMRTTMNLLVVNMAASDLLTTVLIIPVDIGTFTKGEWPIRLDSTAGLVLCKTVFFVWYLSSGVSLLSLVAISVDRFWAVFYQTFQSLVTRKPIITLVSIWLVSFIFGFPNLIEARVFQEVNGRLTCWSDLEFSPYFECPYLAFFGVFPTIVTLVMYPAILIKLWKRRIPGNPSSTNKELRAKTNFKVTILALSLMASYTLSWLPYIGDRIGKLHNAHDSAFDISQANYILCYASCVLNPFVCIVLNQNFRSGFRQILQPLCRFRCVRTNNFENNRASTFKQGSQNFVELNKVQLTGIRTLTCSENLGEILPENNIATKGKV